MLTKITDKLYVDLFEVTAFEIINSNNSNALGFNFARIRLNNESIEIHDVNTAYAFAKALDEGKMLTKITDELYVDLFEVVAFEIINSKNSNALGFNFARIRLNNELIEIHDIDTAYAFAKALDDYIKDRK